MKSILPAIILAIGLSSCATQEQNAKLAAISNIAIAYAEAKGAITKEDAALVREAGTILLTPTAEALPPIVIEASAK